MFARPFWSALFPLILGSISYAQCAEWDTGFTPYRPGTGGPVNASLVFDDGSGPELYVGGSFLYAGTTLARNIAKWDGTSWSAVGPAGGGFDGSVLALTVFDDGSGPALYAGGAFYNANGLLVGSIARWDGAQWNQLQAPILGPNFYVRTMVVFDDGSGPALFVGGDFTMAGGMPADHVAKWDGTSWSALGGGVNASVYSLAVFDDGGGPALHVGGSFTSAGGVPANSIAKWDGTTWAALGTGVSGSVYALDAFDDGSGTALFAGGTFTTAGGIAAPAIARWDGTSWSALGAPGSGANSYVFTLESYDDGSGAKLFAGGNFTSIGGTGAVGLAGWNGASWSATGAGADLSVRSLTVFDDGSGAKLHAGGALQSAGGLLANYIARWDGASWSTLGTPGAGIDGSVHALHAFDDGSGPALYAGGIFIDAGTAPAFDIARWNGAAWSALGAPGDGMNETVRALIGFDDGSGPALYAGGDFTLAGGVPASHIARWNGTSWSALGPPGSGMESSVRCLAVFDDGSGPALYAGGSFSSAGGVFAQHVARWDGTSWSALGDGTGGWVYALAVFDDGSGPALYAGGQFLTAGGPGNPAHHIAKWNGTSWSPLGASGGGTSGPVFALAVHDDGSGEALYVGGSFGGVAGALPAGRIAKWDGSGWSALGTGVQGSSVTALTSYDGGAGAVLVAGGTFTLAGLLPVKNVATWDGASWSPLGQNYNGVDGPVQALASFGGGGDGDSDLYLAGTFMAAGSYLLVGPYVSQCIALWHGCANEIVSFCFGDGTGAACPCSNDGLPGHGCRNSTSVRGAELSTSGTLAPDTLVLEVGFEPPTALSIFLQGNAALPGPVVFGDGLRCIGGTLKRLYTKNAVGGVVSAPAAGDPSVTEQSAILGDPIAAGSTRYYQTYYRDPDPSFCAAPLGDTWNVSNGVAVTW